MINTTQLRFLRKPEVLKLTGFSKSTLQNRVDEGLVPAPINLGDRAVGFLEIEIQKVLAAMAAGRSKEEIKELVEYLVDSRHKYAEALEGF